jgi:hypothetical protein
MLDAPKVAALYDYWSSRQPRNRFRSHAVESRQRLLGQLGCKLTFTIGGWQTVCLAGRVAAINLVQRPGPGT